MPIEGIDNTIQFRLFASYSHLYPQTQSEAMREKYGNHAPPPSKGNTILEPGFHRGGCSLYSCKQEILDARREAWRNSNSGPDLMDLAFNAALWFGKIIKKISAMFFKPSFTTQKSRTTSDKQVSKLVNITASTSIQRLVPNQLLSGRIATPMSTPPPALAPTTNHTMSITMRGAIQLYRPMMLSRTPMITRINLLPR